MKKIVDIYSICLGGSIIGLWTVLLISGNVPELITDPIAISFHLLAEASMGILLIISGIALKKKKNWGKLLFILANGFVMYSVINSSGYYGGKGEWAMVIMFALILILSVSITFAVFQEINKEERNISN